MFDNLFSRLAAQRFKQHNIILRAKKAMPQQEASKITERRGLGCTVLHLWNPLRPELSTVFTAVHIAL